jgi:hypothetical protein
MIIQKITKLCIYCRGGRQQGPTVVPHGIRYTRDTVTTANVVGHGGTGPVYFQKFVIFRSNSDEDKLYMKIVVFNNICNFVVQLFFI